MVYSFVISRPTYMSVTHTHIISVLRIRYDLVTAYQDEFISQNTRTTLNDVITFNDDLVIDSENPKERNKNRYVKEQCQILLLVIELVYEAIVGSYINVYPIHLAY